MARLSFLFALTLGALLWMLPAHARAGNRGVAVVVAGEAAELGEGAWLLAKSVYASPGLLPASMNEARARALVGSNSESSPAVEELGELRAAIHDEGAVSRQVVASIGQTTGAVAVAVVRASELPGHVQVRLFLLEPQPNGATQVRVDASMYDGVATDPQWRTDLVRSLEQRFAGRPAEPKAAKEKASVRRSEGAERPFYRSPWFWAGIGAAVALGGTALLVTQLGGSNDEVRVRVEPPPSNPAALAGVGGLRW